MDGAPSPYFIPSPQSVVRNPQSLFYTDRSSISLIVDDRLWFHSVIQTGDLPSFFQNLTDTDVIVVSSGYQTKTFEMGLALKMCK